MRRNKRRKAREIRKTTNSKRKLAKYLEDGYVVEHVESARVLGITPNNALGRRLYPPIYHLVKRPTVTEGSQGNGTDYIELMP